MCVTFSGLLGLLGAPSATAETRPSKCDNRHKLYFPGLLESLSSVMHLTL